MLMNTFEVMCLYICYIQWYKHTLYPEEESLLLNLQWSVLSYQWTLLPTENCQKPEMKALQRQRSLFLHPLVFKKEKNADQGFLTASQDSCQVYGMSWWIPPTNNVWPKFYNKYTHHQWLKCFNLIGRLVCPWNNF